MPALGADMEAGTLVEWLVKPGDRVKKGDIVAVVETQKGAIEVEIFDEGVVSELVVPVGTKVPVGGVLARIGGEAAREPTLPLRATAAAAGTYPQPRSCPPSSRRRCRSRPHHSGAGGKITPAARRRAAELGIDPAGLTGTGVDGSVTFADVELAARGPRRADPPTTGTRARTGPALTRREMRKAIAAAMARSKREIPHYYLSHTIDFGPA